MEFYTPACAKRCVVEMKVRRMASDVYSPSGSFGTDAKRIPKSRASLLGSDVVACITRFPLRIFVHRFFNRTLAKIRAMFVMASKGIST